MKKSNEITLVQLKNRFTTYTRFIARPDGTFTITDFKGGSTGQREVTERIHNRQSDGLSFSLEAKRRLKNMLISAAMNGVFASKNTLWATFTFPSTDSIPNYDETKHDKVLYTVFQKCIANLRKNYGLQDYTIVTERHKGERVTYEYRGKTLKIKGFQSKKGWLHFHTILCFDSFIDVQLLNYLWLKYCNKYLQCKIMSYEKFQEFSEKIALCSDTELLRFTDPYGRCSNSSSFISSNNMPDSRLSRLALLAELRQAYEKQDLSALNSMLYRTPTAEGVKPYSKLIFNPLDVEFFDCNLQDSIRKISNYITKYITKGYNCQFEKKDENGETYKDGTLIYCRVWQASRLFTSQKIRENVTKEFFNEIPESDIYQVFENKIELIDKETGEIHEIPVYTVVSKYTIYQNQKFINLFKNDTNSQADSRFLRSQRTYCAQTQEVNL